MIANGNHSDRCQRLLCHFVFAGGSALILSFAHFHSEYWFVYLFALVPFLWRISRIDLVGSVVSGFFLAVCYSFVVYIDEAFLYPGIFIARFVFLCVTLTAFALIVNQLKKKQIFNPVYIALLWLPFEYFHYFYLGRNGIFSIHGGGAGIAWRVVSLYGFLAVSFIVVAVNTMILLIIESFCKLTLPGFIFLFQFQKSLFLENGKFVYFRQRCLLPDLRGPPAPERIAGLFFKNIFMFT